MNKKFMLTILMSLALTGCMPKIQQKNPDNKTNEIKVVNENNKDVLDDYSETSDEKENSKDEISLGAEDGDDDLELSGNESNNDAILEDSPEVSIKTNEEEKPKNKEAVKPSESKPAISTNTPKPNTSTNMTKPNTSNSTASKPTTTKPVETKPAETKPSTSNSGTTTKPAETKPNASTGGNTTTTKPAETKPNETKPVEQKPEVVPDIKYGFVNTVVPYETEIRYNNDLYTNDQKLIQKGVKGMIVHKATYTYINGKLTNTEKTLHSETKPVKEIIEKGTKPIQDSSKEVKQQALNAFDYINQYRQDNGLNKLEWSDTIYDFSLKRAKESTEHFSHTRPNGQKWYTVSPSYKLYGENLATGYSDYISMVDAWKASPAHNSHMLVPNITKAAVALIKLPSGYGYYWVLLSAIK